MFSVCGNDVDFKGACMSEGEYFLPSVGRMTWWLLLWCSICASKVFEGNSATARHNKLKKMEKSFRSQQPGKVKCIFNKFKSEMKMNLFTKSNIITFAYSMQTVDNSICKVKVCFKWLKSALIAAFKLFKEAPIFTPASCKLLPAIHGNHSPLMNTWKNDIPLLSAQSLLLYFSFLESNI